MRPLTDRTPKPLLRAGGKPLIVHLMERLCAAGLSDFVINHAYLGASIEKALGGGQDFGARIRYSPEPPPAFGTGGGIRHALPLLGSERFLVVNADIWTDYPFSRLAEGIPDSLAHLVLVDKPSYKDVGDFDLSGHRVSNGGSPPLTFSGIGVYRPELFADCGPGAFPLGPVLRREADAGHVNGERYAGQWVDVGTPGRLAELDSRLRAVRAANK